jgi:hypothetical protein
MHLLITGVSSPEPLATAVSAQWSRLKARSKDELERSGPSRRPLRTVRFYVKGWRR